jgi:hypothetical protein
VHAGPHGRLVDGVRRPTRGVELDPVVEDDDANRALDRVVAVRDGVDDGLAQRLPGKLRPGSGSNPRIWCRT